MDFEAEMRKVEKREKSGAGTENTYTPKLNNWIELNNWNIFIGRVKATWIPKFNWRQLININ